MIIRINSDWRTGFQHAALKARIDTLDLMNLAAKEAADARLPDELRKEIAKQLEASPELPWDRVIFKFAKDAYREMQGDEERNVDD